VTSTNLRLFLWVGLFLALYLNYEAWMRDYGPKPGAVPPAPITSPSDSSLGATIPSASVPTATTSSSAVSGGGAGTTDGSTATSAAAVPTPAATTAATAAAASPVGTPALPAAGESITVRTDVLDLRIGLIGGELTHADLLTYPITKGEATPVRLFTREGREGFFVLQTGLAGATPGSAHPTHLARFSAAQTAFTLGAGQNELRVPLSWTDGNGVTVVKTFVFRRGQYRVALEYAIQNASETSWQAASYAQFLRDDIQIERSMFDVESYAFKGPAYFDGTKYQKLTIDSDDDRALSRDIQNGWIAAMQHHFVAAVVPSAASAYRFGLKVDGRQYLLSAAGPLQTVAPGASATLKETLFVGPKLQSQLVQTGPELDLVADYGMLAILARPLFWLLEQAHKLTGNWGWAIILITALLKLVFYPLSEASGKSMAKMRVLAPRIKNLQDTYKDDREKLGKAMMEMYQREKINPLAGCLPILIQMPVFFAFYWVLLESVEMRQAPFMAWIQDLSARDPWFVLPAIMAGAMFVQYKLNPAPPDPIQAKVFMFLPLIMSVTFAFFPSGLVLYWVTNTLLSIAQQWNINRRIELAAKKGKAAEA
jgi:YidC/Oxa1 family membrane protein insertase